MERTLLDEDSFTFVSSIAFLLSARTTVHALSEPPRNQFLMDNLPEGSPCH